LLRLNSNMLKEIVISIQSYFKAHAFIQKHKLWRWIILPGIIYAILFGVSMYFFSKSANAAIEWLTIETGLKGWLNRLQDSWIGFLFTVGGIMLWLILMLLYFSLFKYIWLIVGAPVFSFLSERTASIIKGEKFEFSFNQYLSDVLRGMRMALRNTLWQTVYIISIIFLSLLPFIGWISPIIAILVECYYYGFSMLDYTCEREKMSANKSIDFIGSHKGLAIGNGIVFYLLHCLLVVGWVLAPAYAVIAATISMYEVRDNKKID
jgi:CysZ protein